MIQTLAFAKLGRLDRLVHQALMVMMGLMECLVKMVKMAKMLTHTKCKKIFVSNVHQVIRSNFPHLEISS